MRRLLISFVLPTLFCLAPIAAAIVVAVSIPSDAMNFFLGHISYMDVLILGLGTVLFTAQLIVAWQALRWRGTGFDKNTDRWVTHLAQAAEWFPMLGLLGTVGGILQTFGSFEGVATVRPSVIIERYSPAITATGAGLYMAFVNILPTWVVMFGRDIILTLGGGRAQVAEEAAP